MEGGFPWNLIEAHFGSKRYQDCAEQLQMKFSNVPVTDKQTLHCDSVNSFRETGSVCDRHKSRCTLNK